MDMILVEDQKEDLEIKVLMEKPIVGKIKFILPPIFKFFEEG
jgi:hypothetical protein